LAEERTGRKDALAGKVGGVLGDYDHGGKIAQQQQTGVLGRFSHEAGSQKEKSNQKKKYYRWRTVPAADRKKREIP